MGLVSKEMIADLIINIINILVLFFLTKALLYKPVKKYLNARRERLAAEQAARERLDAERRRKEALERRRRALPGRISLLQQKLQADQEELANLKGLLSAMRREELEAEIARLHTYLRNLQQQLADGNRPSDSAESHK